MTHDPWLMTLTHDSCADAQMHVYAGLTKMTQSNQTHDSWSMIHWCCFNYFIRKSLVALQEALFARVLRTDQTHNLWSILIDGAFITAWLHKKWNNSFAGSSIWSNFWWLIKLKIYDLWSITHDSSHMTHALMFRCTFTPDSAEDSFNVDGEIGKAAQTHITVLPSAVSVFFALPWIKVSRLMTRDSWCCHSWRILACWTLMNRVTMWMKETMTDDSCCLRLSRSCLTHLNKKNHARWVMHVYVFTYSFRHAYVLCCSVRPVLQCVGGVLWCSVMQCVSFAVYIRHTYCGNG